MKAVLLAAGLGTRLRPITDHTPKCLVPINGQPLLDYWLEMLTDHSQIEHIYINLHYKAEQVREHIASKWSSQDNITCWYEPELLGTAGTLVENYQHIKDDDCLVIHADNFSLFSLNEFLQQHQATNAAMTMMLFRTDHPQSCGIVELDENQKVIAMHEKVENPPGDLANAAVYVFSAQILEFIHSKKLTDISNEVIPACLGNIKGWLNSIYHRDIGTPESYKIANRDAREIFPTKFKEMPG